MRVRRVRSWLAGCLWAALFLIPLARAQEGTCTRTGPAAYSPGEVLSLRLVLAPLADTILHAVTETLPPGVELVSADGDAVYSAASRELRWGVFFDGRVRTLSYRVRVSSTPPAALAWLGGATFDATEVPVTGLPESLRRGAAAGTVRRLLPADFTPGQAFEVRLAVEPDAAIGFHAVDEGVPAGWLVSDISTGGLVGGDGRVKWGPFPDAEPRGLTYRLTPPNGATNGRFSGRGLFGEIDVTIGGTNAIAVRPTGTGTIRRSLPVGYRFGQVVEVSLRLEPAAAVSLHAVEEVIPAGWSIQEAPGAAAVDRTTGRIRWGPFVEPLARTLVYRLMPAAETNGLVSWAGSADFDAATVATTGDESLAPRQRTPTQAVREMPEVFRAGQLLTVGLTVRPGEGVEAFGVQENLPSGWTVVAAVGAGIEGQRLTWGPFFDAVPRTFTYQVRAPLGISGAANFAGNVTENGATVAVAGVTTIEPAPPPGGQVTRSLPLDFIPGALFQVTNRVVPDAGVAFNVVAESVPAGWTVLQAVPEGVLDATTGQYKWGPFTDDQVRELVLSLRSPTNAAAVVTFAGSGNFAGVEKVTAGTAAVPRNLPPFLSAVGDQFVREDEPLALRLVARDDLRLGTHLALTVEADPPALFPAAGREQIIEGNTRIIVLTPAFEASGVATIRLTLNDGTHEVRREFRVSVTALNDAPRFSLPAVTGTVLEDGPPVSLTGFQVLDDDAGNAPLELTLRAGGGTLSLAPAEAALRTDDGADSTTLRLRGSQAALNGVLPRVRVQPAPDFFGDLVLTLEASDAGERGPGGPQTGRAEWILPVVPVNDAPVNQPPPVPELIVREDASAEATRFERWLPGLRVGPTNEAAAGQRLLSEISVGVPGLFRVPPRIAADGTLTFQLAPDANGSTEVAYWFRDNGGRANGGRDTSPTNRFRLVVLPVNDPPVVVATNRTDLVLAEDAPANTTRFPGWVTQVRAGPADEIQARQALVSVVEVDRPELFRRRPTLEPDGTLSFELAPDRFGAAVVRYFFEDDGGTDAGGWARSATNIVVLTVAGLNDPPAARLPPRLSVRADVGPVEVRLGGVSAGPFETGADALNLAASGAAVTPGSLVRPDGVQLAAYFPETETLLLRLDPAVSVSADGELRLRLADQRGAFTDFAVPVRFVVGSDPPTPMVPVPADWNATDPVTGLPRIDLVEDESPRTLELGGLFAAQPGRELRFSVGTNTLADVVEVAVEGDRLRLTPRPDRHGEGIVLLLAENDDYTVAFEFVVGVAARADGPRPPVVTDRTVAVRPGLALRLPAAVVLQDAADPEGLPVSLVPAQFRTPAGTEVRVTGEGVLLTPKEPATEEEVAVEVSDGTLRSALRLWLRPAASLAGEMRRTLPGRFRPGQILSVTLTPTEPLPAGTTVREMLPAGWMPERIPAGTIWRSDTRTLEWPPRPADFGGELQYQVVAGQTNSPAQFIGETVQAQFALAIGGAVEVPPAPIGRGEVTRQLPADFIADEVVEVVLRAEPAPTTDRWFLRETLPAGWHLVSAEPVLRPTGAGEFASDVFLGAGSRELRYRVRAPANPAAAAEFAGAADFDGQPVAVLGAAALPWNEPPAATLPEAGGREDELLRVALPRADAAGEPLSWVVSGIGGVVAAATLVADGSAVEIRPEPDRSGAGQVRLSVSDGRQAVATSLAVVFAPVNDAPSVVSRTFSGQEDRVLALQLAGTDPEGDPLTFRVLRPPRHGRLELQADGSGQYVPAPDYFGEDDFVCLAHDGAADSRPETVGLVLAPVHDAPRPRPDSLRVTAGETVSITAAALLANDDNPDRGLLRVLRLGPVPRGRLEAVGEGRWDFHAPADFAGGFFLETVVSDGIVERPSVVHLEIGPRPGAPRAEPDRYSREVAPELEFSVADLLANDGSPNGPVRFVAVDGASQNGRKLSWDGGDRVRLEASARFSEDRFWYQVEDTAGQRSAGEVVVDLFAAPGRIVRLAPASATEWELEWTGTAGAVYRLERGQSLADRFALMALVATGPEGAGRRRIPDFPEQAFFRLVPDVLPGHFPRISALVPLAESGWELRLSGLPGRAYELLQVDPDSGDRRTLGSVVIPPGGVVSEQLPADAPSAFFQLLRWVPPAP
jgi:hypothetical protein